ncbi:glycosyltransferase [Candidatus Micrarchaeota archaeon]|nr:glycosyltransferase [Candidatus Micrarchaeota archaeon]
MLSIIIPTRNEAPRIGAAIGKLASFIKSHKRALGRWADYEIIISDDGTDGTIEVAKNAAAKLGVKRQLHPLHSRKRLGKGLAVTVGMRAARGDALLYDADASTPPREILKLKKALDAGADVAIGSRRLPASSVRVRPPLRRRAASRIFNSIIRTLFGMPFADTQCGFKAFKRRAYLKLVDKVRNTGYVWDVEMILLALEEGMRVEEVPIEWSHSKNERFASPYRTVAQMLLSVGKLKASRLNRHH